MAFEHNSRVKDNEPDWADVDKTALPPEAFAFVGDPELKSTWAFPHHWVFGGTTKDDRGVWTDGELFLHRGGLNAAWAAAMGARSGERASQEVIDHLMSHRRDLGIEESHNCNLTLHGSAMVEAAKRDEEVQEISVIAYTGRPVDVGWGAPVIIDVGGLEIRQQIPLRWNHSAWTGIGHTTEVRKLANSMVVARGVVSRKTAEAREVRESAKAGFPWRASVGATPLDVVFLADGEQASVNERVVAGPMYVVKRATLDEISVVDLPADIDTSVIMMSNHSVKPLIQEGDTMEVEKVEQQSVDLNERRRVEALRFMFSHDVAFVDEAIAAGWSVDEAKNERLSRIRAKRAQDVPHNRGDSAVQFEKAIVCALVRHSVGEGSFTPDVLEQADKYKNLDLGKLAFLCLRHEGIHVDVSSSKEQVIRAAFSTRSFPAILRDSAGKVLLSGYQAVDKASLRVARVVPLSDFKQHNLVRLTGDYTLRKIAGDEEIPHAHLHDQEYPVRADTYARMVALTRQDVINDDLGAFVDMPARIGRGAALALEKAFWDLFVNAGFYSAANGNLVTANPLTVDNIDKAVAAMTTQKDEDGEYILARPKFLVVPPGLEGTAKKIFTSTTIVVSGTTNRVLGQDNPHVGLYEPVSTPYLSGDDWYMVADPQDLPAFAIGFLDGRAEPTIEEVDMSGSYLGVAWRAYMDFGVAKVDHRAVVKSQAT